MVSPAQKRQAFERQNIMYLRFISPLRQRRRDLHMGIFQAVIKCRDDVDMPAWLHAQLIKEFQWFKDYLPSPDDRHFDRWTVRGYHPDAICWFKASAKQMISRSWALKALIEEAGMPLSVMQTDQPGKITYEDKYQIVAHPYLWNKPRFR